MTEATNLAAVQVAATDDTPAVSKRTSVKRPLIKATDRPAGVLNWSTKREKREALWTWRRSVCNELNKDARAIRLAWLLQQLVTDDGFAFPSNDYLAKEIGSNATKVQASL